MMERPRLAVQSQFGRDKIGQRHSSPSTHLIFLMDAIFRRIILSIEPLRIAHVSLKFAPLVNKVLNCGLIRDARVAALAEENNVSDEIARIQRRLADLDVERAALARDLEALEQKQLSDHRATATPSVCTNTSVTNNSSSAEKIALFRRAPGCLSNPMGKQEDRTIGIFASLLQ